MGCNGSKKADNSAAAAQRERTREPASPARGDAPAAAVSTPTRGGADGGQEDAARSYTDQRTLEQDYFKQVIERTARNFIDVGETGTVLETNERAAKEEEYAAALAGGAIDGAAAAGGLLAVPTGSAETSASALTEKSALMGEDEQALLGTALAAVVAALGSMQIEHKGSLVVDFPSIG